MSAGLEQNWGPFPEQIEFYYENGVLTPTFPPQINFKIKDASSVLSELDASNGYNPKYTNTGFGCSVAYYGSAIEFINPMCYTNMGYPTQDGIIDIHYDGMTFPYTPIFQNLQLLPAGDYSFTHSFVVYGLTYSGNVWERASEYIFQTILKVRGVTPPPANTPPTFTPSNLSFVHNRGDALPSKTLAISGTSWELIGKPNFAISSITPGVTINTLTGTTGQYQVVRGSGSANINIALTDFYETNAIFNPEDLSIFFVVVNLLNDQDYYLPITVEVKSISDFLILPNPKDEIAFTLDPEFYKVKTTYKDTYFQFDTTIKTYNYLSHEENTTFIPQRIVPFKGNGQINLGKVIHRLMHKIDAPNHQEIQYQQAKIQIVCTEKLIGTDAAVRTGTTPWIPYLAGLSRGVKTTGFLDFNPKPNRVTQNSFAYLNLCVSETNYEIKLYKNGEFQNVIDLDIPAEKVITKKLTFNNFTKGDVLEYVLDKKGQNNNAAPIKRYIVFPDSFYSYHLVWENEFKVQSVLECTGTASIKTEFDTIEQKLYKNLVEVVETIDNSKEVKLTINTGWLLETDVDTIESLLRSQRIWMVKNNQDIALRSKPKAMINRDLERELIEYTLEFTINRAYDEETYTL